MSVGGVVVVLPRMLFYLGLLRRNLRLKPFELRNLQLKRLRALVRHAYENVAFYHRKFREAGIKPDDVMGLDDLRKLPVVTKFEIQACSFNEVVDRRRDVNSLVKKTTSGSTGIPLTVFADQRVEDFYAAVWMRAMFEDGLRVRDKMAVIADPRTFPKKKTFFQRLGVSKRYYISIFDPADKQLAVLREFSPDVVKGYASSLFILAKEFGESLRDLKARLIFSGAEPLDIESRRAIASAFNAELFDFYGCVEFSLLAWECKEHNGYHVNADSVLMEVLDDDGEAVGLDEKGKIVCTGLFNDVMPLIRYDLGDVAVLTDDGCGCGVSLSLLRFVEGRKDDFLMATDGRIIC